MIASSAVESHTADTGKKTRDDMDPREDSAIRVMEAAAEVDAVT